MSSGKVGIVAFSFAQRPDRDEPNPCNVRLAQETARLAAQEPNSVVVAQWEVAKALRTLGVAVSQEVSRPADGAYLDSKDVWAAALASFQAEAVDVVIPVAQPFLHLAVVRRMVEESPLRLQRAHIRWIGFDTSPANTQWWTRGPFRLLAYAVLGQLFGGRVRRLWSSRPD